MGSLFEVANKKELFTVKSPGAIAAVYGTKFNFKKLSRGFLL